MDELISLLKPESVIADLAASNKKALFQALAATAERATGIGRAEIFDKLQERERLGTTGFGGGVAIPHGRMEGLPGIVAAFARLEKPIDYGAIDDMPVDLVFMLLSPVDAGAEHLKMLAGISRKLRDRAFVAKLRGAGSPDALYALFASSETRDAA